MKHRPQNSKIVMVCERELKVLVRTLKWVLARTQLLEHLRQVLERC